MPEVPSPGAAAILKPWEGPRGGYPTFDGVTAASLKEALTGGMAAQRAEVAAIVAAHAASPPTFVSVMEALENSGRALQRAVTVYGIYTSTMNDAAMQALEAEMEPVLAAFQDELVQDAGLFALIKAVFEGSRAGLNAEQDRLLVSTYERFVRNGAALDVEAKKALGDINTRLAGLYAKFGQNLLAEEGSQMLVLTAEAELAGLPAAFVAGLKDAAEAKAKDGKVQLPAWAVANTRSAMEPFLTLSTRRDLREKAFKLFASRGENAGPNDNRPVMREILVLRKRKAELLGFDSFAAWIISDNMARTPATARALLDRVWTVAVKAAESDIVKMQKIAAADGVEGPLEPWDHRFYAEKLRKAEFDLDDAEVKPYLPLERMMEGMLWSAERLHNIRFVPVPAGEVPVCHPDVRVYEVVRVAEGGAAGERVGLFYYDPYAREGKRSGAWMSDYRPQEDFATDARGVTPVISNNCNFMKAPAGEPNLVSWDDVTTMFHELGHALHGLLSRVHYPTLSGTNVKRDFVELPSQLNEHWQLAPEMLRKFARHYETNEPLPDALLKKIEAAKNANQGFGTVEYLASAIYDAAIHVADPEEAGAEGYGDALMQKLGLPRAVAMRHRPAHFQHVFSTEGYAAQYYSYIWADVLTADVAEAFHEVGDMFHAETAAKLRSTILEVGNSIDPAVAFRSFRGRDPDPDALMRDRGFA